MFRSLVHGVYVLSSLNMFCLVPGTVILYFLLPETKGKSLQEIEDYFCGRTTSLKNKPNTLTVPKGELLP